MAITDAPNPQPTAATRPRGWIRRFTAGAARLAAHSWAPLALLAVVSVLSLAARAWSLDQPCTAPCNTAADHSLIFDEVYYVNAARRIDGIAVPGPGHYASAPAGVDPNAEHPQLAKLVIAESIRFFGDGPLAWRLGSLIFGSLAILGMYALVRAAGGGSWLALSAAALMAADNLLLVHGRIGTLDIYVLAFMIWSVVLFLRGRHLLAGVLLGVGTCVKLVAPYVLLVLALVEILRWLSARRRRAEVGSRPRLWRQVGGLAVCATAAAAVYVGLLAILDRLVPPYDPNTGATLHGPFEHTAHMVRFAASLTNPGGAQGIASYPWQWLADWKPIVYFNVDAVHVVNGQVMLDSTTHFLGVINPLILVFAVPAFILAAVRAYREGNGVDIVGAAWCAGTYVPFVVQSALWHRISYLYYMVIVMPGVYLVTARLFTRRWMTRPAIAAWACLILVATGVLYPFVTLPDPNWV